jgi:hypothetical protein
MFEPRAFEQLIELRAAGERLVQRDEAGGGREGVLDLLDDLGQRRDRIIERRHLDVGADADVFALEPVDLEVLPEQAARVQLLADEIERGVTGELVVGLDGDTQHATRLDGRGPELAGVDADAQLPAAFMMVNIERARGRRPDPGVFGLGQIEHQRAQVGTRDRITGEDLCGARQARVR